MFPTPQKKSVNFEDFSSDLYSFSSFGALFGGGGKPNFAGRNFMDTQTFLRNRGGGVLFPPFQIEKRGFLERGFLQNMYASLAVLP